MRYFHASKTHFDVGTELAPAQPGGAVFVFEGNGDPQQLFDGGFFIQAGCEFPYGSSRTDRWVRIRLRC